MPDDSFKTIPVVEETTVKEVHTILTNKMLTNETVQNYDLAKFAIFEEPLDGRGAAVLLSSSERVSNIKNKWDSSKRPFRFVYKSNEQKIDNVSSQL